MTQFSIAENHPCLAGHFPGQPIVPGVLIAAEVIRLATPDYPNCRLRQCKFLRSLQAEHVCEVSFVPRSVGNSVDFRCDVAQECIAKGQLIYEN